MKELRKEDIKQEVFDLYDNYGFRSRDLSHEPIRNSENYTS
jgi:hypothetical protein